MEPPGIHRAARRGHRPAGVGVSPERPAHDERWGGAPQAAQPGGARVHASSGQALAHDDGGHRQPACSTSLNRSARWTPRASSATRSASSWPRPRSARPTPTTSSGSHGRNGCYPCWWASSPRRACGRRPRRRTSSPSTWVRSRPRLREHPTDGLFSIIVNAEEGGSHLSEVELVGFAHEILGASFDSTANTVESVMWMLLRHPDQLAKLREDPSLWPAAIEEVLRDVSIGTMLLPRMAVSRCRARRRDDPRRARPRLCTSTVRTAIPRCSRIPIGSDICRESKQHLSFGFGTHFCLGAGLARMGSGSCCRWCSTACRTCGSSTRSRHGTSVRPTSASWSDSTSFGEVTVARSTAVRVASRR